MSRAAFAASSLDIRGSREERVPHTFFRQAAGAHHLAMIFPGLGYRAQMPLLYYPARLLLGLGADVLRLEYAYDLRDDLRALSDAEKDRWFQEDMTAACRAALAQRAYRDVTLVGKSGGTLAMGHLLTTEPALAQARAVWLTPLFKFENLRQQIRRSRPRSLVVVGAADPEYDPAHLADVQAATPCECVVVEGADHGLEIAGDVLASLKAMERIVRAVRAFVA